MDYNLISGIAVISLIFAITSFIMPANLCDTFLILGLIGFSLIGAGLAFSKSPIIGSVLLVLIGLFVVIISVATYGFAAIGWILLGLMITITGLLGYANYSSNLSTEHKIVSVLSKLEPIGYVFISIGFVFSLMYMLMNITGLEMMFAWRIGLISLIVGVTIVVLDEISDNYQIKNVKVVVNESS